MEIEQFAPRPPLALRFRPRQRLALDTTTALAYAAAAWLVLGRRVDPAPLALTAIVAVSWAIALARHRPTLALAIALTGFCLAPLDANFAFVALVPAGYALACAAAAAPPRVSARALTLALAGAAATALPAFEHRGAVVPFALCLLAAWLLGTLLGQERRYRDELAEATLIQERLRIARDVHDVLAHSVSLITVQAGYGSLIAPARPTEAADVLATIAQTGRETLGEIRRLVTILRHHEVGHTTAPAPTFADIATLVDQTSAAGIPVALTVEGAQRPLSPTLELCGYRIVQEALTNVVRHAQTASAAVCLEFTLDALIVRVTDDGVADASLPADGHGLRGMRERVALVGGSLRAAPLPAGGFEVEARLPLQTPA